MDDLSDVYTNFYDTRDKWFNIGMALNIKFSTLKSIKSEHHDNDDCLREVLAHRIQSGGPLTWADLTTCLRHPTVGRRDLADKIDQGLTCVKITGLWGSLSSAVKLFMHVAVIYSMQFLCLRPIHHDCP